MIEWDAELREGEKTTSSYANRSFQLKPWTTSQPFWLFYEDLQRTSRIWSCLISCTHNIYIDVCTIYSSESHKAYRRTRVNTPRPTTLTHHITFTQISTSFWTTNRCAIRMSVCWYTMMCVFVRDLNQQSSILKPWLVLRNTFRIQRRLCRSEITATERPRIHPLSTSYGIRTYYSWFNFECLLHILFHLFLIFFSAKVSYSLSRYLENISLYLYL